VNIQLLVLAVLTTTLGAVVTQAADVYPLATCVVSGKTLGSMGSPVILLYQGIEVRFCCDGCVKKFHADPDTYLAKLGKKESVQ
jgi:YHS domain-containing protein